MWDAGWMRTAPAAILAILLISCSSPEQAKHKAPTYPSADAFERITAPEAVKRLTQCNLGPVTVRYDADLDEDVLIVKEIKSATDEQLGCADKAVSFYTLQLPSNIQTRYDAMRKARLSGVFQSQARAWLSARGLLDQVPKYQEGVTNDAVFTRQIEALCGPRAKGAFQSKLGFHAVSPDWAMHNLNLPDEGGDALTCLMSVGAVAGFRFGFIGNGYYRR